MVWTPTPPASIPNEETILALLTRSGTDPATGYITPSDIEAAWQAFMSRDYWLHRTVATEAARVALTATAGMRCYVTGTKREYLYDGTGWIIMREPAQTTATATARQNAAAVASTQTSPTAFHRSDGYCDLAVFLGITGTGVNAQPFDVAMAGHPAPLASGISSGPFAYYDASFGTYVGTATLSGSGIVSFAPPGSNWTLGGNPAFAAANGDVISFTLRYRMSNLYEAGT